MPTSKPSTSAPVNGTASDNEFAQLLVDSRAAATILAETINQENQIFLSFCGDLISQTLHAVDEMSKIAVDSAKEGASKQVAKAQEKAAKNVAAAAKTAQNAVADSGSKASKGSKKSGKSDTSDLDKNTESLAEGFVSSMLISMQNSVAAQNNMFTIAQAATTQTVMAILSTDTAAAAIAVNEISKGKK